MKDGAAPPEDTFYCARCQTVFADRPLFCPNCDSLKKQRAQSKGTSGSLFRYLCLLFLVPGLLSAVVGIVFWPFLFFAIPFLLLFAVFGAMAGVPALWEDVRDLEGQFRGWQCRVEEDD